MKNAKSRLHFNNANYLTHIWHPESTSQTLLMNEIGQISVTYNIASANKTLPSFLFENAAYKELTILNRHCLSMAKEATVQGEHLNLLPKTNLIEKYDKITQYQGSINLLIKHYTFLKHCASVLERKFLNSNISSKFFLDKLRFNTLLKNYSMSLDLLNRNINRLKTRQQVVNTGLTPNLCSTTSGDHEFVIGEYSLDNTLYDISIGFAEKSVPGTLGHPLKEFLYIQSTERNIKRSKGSVCFMISWEKNVPQDSSEIQAMDLAGLFFSNRKFTYAEPKAIIYDWQLDDCDERHVQKIYQAIVEWTYHAQVKDIVYYGYETQAYNYYMFGFKAPDNAQLNEQSAQTLETCLQNQTSPSINEESSEDMDEPSEPFILNNYRLHDTWVYQFNPGIKQSYKELIETHPTLTKSKLTYKLPDFLGGPDTCLPNKLMQRLRQRAIGGPWSKNTAIVVEQLPVDYRDLRCPTALASCAHLSEQEVRSVSEKGIYFHKRNIIKQRQC